MLKIKVFKPQTPNEVQEIELSSNNLLAKEFLIGRLPSCDFVLSNSNISRQHAKIIFQAGRYHFIDLGSSGGSWLNQTQVKSNQQYPLKSGDVLRVAEYHLEITAIAFMLEATVVTPREGAIAASLAQTLVVQDFQLPIEWIEPTAMERWVKGELTVRCSHVIDETQDVKTFRFVTNPPVLFTYKPGQFVTLDLEIGGESVLRSYSISSTPSRPHTLEITVKRVPPPTDSPTTSPGLVSNWLHDNVRVGSSLKLGGPFGKFTCFSTPARKLLFISAGSGITPMMGMSRWIYDTTTDCDVVFLHSARSPEDIIYRQELEMMACRQPNFQLALTMTKPASRHGWHGFTGRISASLIQAIAPDFCDRTIYVCGPEGFMTGVKTLMKSLNFPMENYYEESFGPPKKAKKAKKDAKENSVAKNFVTENFVTKVEPQKIARGFGLGAALQGLRMYAPGSGISNSAVGIAPEQSPPPQKLGGSGSERASSQLAVVFSKSGKEVACDGEESILELAEQEGVRIRSSCRAGSCGSCKKLKIGGEVRMENFDPEALEPEEQAAGYILTCISYPMGRVVVDA
jgi:glycine betaine catabolism B